VEPIRKVLTGAKTLVEWLGAGGKAVEPAKANARAEVCASCIHNGTGDWTHYFTVPVSAGIRKMLSIKNAMKLKTDYDSKLNVCEICLCPLPLKVWVDIEHIKLTTDEQTVSALPTHCWIRLEIDSEQA
jgi:hypothetical protein